MNLRFPSICIFLIALGSSAPVHGAGPRLPAIPTAASAAPGYGPEKAVDGDESTLWIANLQPTQANNRTWFQLDLGMVQPVARLHWLAAQGTPYPASAPAEYRVLVSTDGAHWIAVPAPAPQETIEAAGNVLLNTRARFVRLETEKVNDGTGWSLGLREIWVTGGRDDSAAAETLRPRITAQDGALRLEWKPLDGAVQYQLYRSDAPRAFPQDPLVALPGTVHEYLDKTPNYAPRYYRLDALDGRGGVMIRSNLAAGYAHPPAGAQLPTETFAFWYETFRPSTDLRSSLRSIGDASFVVGPGMEAAADLRSAGKGLLPYVTFYQTSGWVGSFKSNADPVSIARAIAPVAFYRQTVQFPGSPHGYIPTVFCRPGNVEYNPAAVQYTTCPNSAPFRQMALAFVKKQLDGGALGFFVDNGYEDDIAAGTTCESTEHAHYYGDQLTGADAFLGLLMDVTCEVKRRNPDGLVIVNGGVPAGARFYGLTLGDVSDGQLWESYLRTSYNTPKEHVDDWNQVYARSIALERAWHATPPRRMFVLSYPWDRQEAFFCYATAKLCNLPWSASLGVDDPGHTHFGGHFGTYPELINLRLGAPIDPGAYGGTRAGSVYFREYQHGLVVVNPSNQPQQATIPLSRDRRYHDLFFNQDGQGASFAASLPPQSGRVLLWQP